MVTNKFIQKAIKKEGALSKQLGISLKNNIPMALLNKIITSNYGETIKNPTKVGKRYLVVTRLMKKRAVLARTLKKIGRG